MSDTLSRTINATYYAEENPGLEDYWKKMAAPRHRVATITRELQRLEPRSVLDLGCGGGQLIAELRQALPEARLSGLDGSAAQISRNRRYDRVTPWFVGDLDAETPLAALPEGAFDAIVSSEVIEHLEHPERLLTHALRLARPREGHLVLSTQSGPVRETERRVGHVRHFSADEMRRLLLKVGWEPVKIWNTGFPFHDLSKWYANRDPDATMRRFGETEYGPFQDTVCALLRLAFLFNSRRWGAQLFAVARRPAPA